MSDTSHFTRTLNIQRPIGRTCLLALLFLGLLILVLEFVLRLEPIASMTPDSNFGGRHQQLETQFARLDLVISQEGKIDCIFLGDSLIWLDIDPETFQVAYTEVTDQGIHCFNFGVSAMPAAAAAELADYLANTYQPDLFIYGVHARDLALPITDEEAQIVINNPWFQYRLGHKTSTNWIRANSAILRNHDYLRSALQLDMQTVRAPLGWTYSQLHGFDAKTFMKVDVNISPDIEDPSQQEGFKWYWDYEIQNENLEALERIARLNHFPSQLIILVMPVHPNFKKFFRHPEDYGRFISTVEETISPTGTPLWVLDDAVDIPYEGWFDYSHLNYDGAQIFSNWLGQKVGTFLQENNLQTQ